MTAGSIVAPLIIPVRIPPPGGTKQQVHTSTPVEIKSDTPGVSIYYTVDGSKPEALQRPGFGGNSTLKYTRPIHLPEGRVSVKALAVTRWAILTRDGRNSATVTKVFLVTLNESKPREENEENLLQNYTSSQETEGTSWWPEAGCSPGSTLRPPVWRVKGGVSHRPPAGPRFLSARLGPQAPVPETSSSHRSQTLNISLQDSVLKNLSDTQTSRIQRETDFLRCARCLCPRPSDPFAHFCLQCGSPVPPVPGQRLPPTEGGQMAICVQCRTTVPVNSLTCVICEAAISPQLQPQASLRLQDKVLCPSCGSGNPGHMCYCVTCESRLPQPSTAVSRGQREPPLSSQEDKMVVCSKCTRINHCDARFCDWCGSKPGHTSCCVMCPVCGASSPPYASYCGTCSVFLEGPARYQHLTSLARPTGGAVLHNLVCWRADIIASPGPSHGAAWQPLRSSNPAPNTVLAPPTADAQTQTVGLFYPSATELHKKHQERALEQSRQEQTRDRWPLLTPVSPGRGYWRKQLDHVSAHLRSYAQNNPDFRALIGEPRMGRVNGEPGSIKTPGQTESQNLSSVTEGRTEGSANSTSLESEQPAALRRPSKRSLAHETTPKPPMKDSQLLKELGSGGRGLISVVQQLLDEGADPSCRDSDGRPALVVAVVNGHHDVVPVLVQRGADINQQSGEMNNTALHEAAARGSEGLLCAEVLLGCKASLRRKNTRGLTAYDLAVSSSCSPMVSLLAAKMGDRVLDQLVRPTARLTLDAF
ncbi:double zinc ribbon and ankyrin repeat-containing protein 1 [Polymixia lowei]